MNFTKTEKRVLQLLLEHERRESNVCSFVVFQKELGLTRVQAKRACRALARKGFAEHGPYWTDYSGLLGGTGYSLTVAGTYEASRMESAKRYAPNS